jgi:hypothetical protein
MEWLTAITYYMAFVIGSGGLLATLVAAYR